MEEEKKENINLFDPFDPEKLLKGHLFYVIDDQILFRYKDEIVLTTISQEKNYTQEDYFMLPEGAPYQLINEKLIFIASPKIPHQRILRIISRHVDNYVTENNLGEVFFAPMDVLLGEK